MKTRTGCFNVFSTDGVTLKTINKIVELFVGVDGLVGVSNSSTDIESG